MTRELRKKSSYTEDPIIYEHPFFIKSRSYSSKISDSSYLEVYNKYYRKRGTSLSTNQSQKKNHKYFPWKALIYYIIIISLFAFIFGFLYIGGLWNPGKKLLGMKYIVVNSDKGCYSNTCARVGFNETMNIGNFYSRLDGTGGRFTVVNGNRADAVEYVKKFKYWAAFYIPEKFTIDVIQNLNSISKSFSQATVEIIVDETRQYTTVSMIRKALRRLQKNFHIYLARSFDYKGSFNPIFLIRGIEYKETSLHTVDKYGQSFATFVTLMLIWIASISASIITHFYFPFESLWLEKKDAKHPILKVICLKILVCGLMTLFITFVVLIIQYICGELQVEKGYPAYFFFVYFFSFCGLAVNNTLIHLLPFIAYYLTVTIFMILQITTCNGILDHSLQYGFWKIGRALPMYYGVRQLKIIFWKVGEHTTVINLIVILLWILFFSSTTIILYVFELKSKREEWLRKEYRKLFNYNESSNESSYESGSNNYDNDNRLNDSKTLITLNEQGIPMESLEDFDIPEDDEEDDINNNISNKTLR
ncbi:hypothetical protein BCR32DRAFT_297749 [Anaeromyces robustus]|uniref:DUF3533 domain-containing protein n=1 Tax=Anaeromyces robustus TaxID=1754192 RepID=A0A1Y1VVQ2_9FUNG|nr:hypothetical protein BCR32DRAFT_297749 [Anaeromyces robustus]|eukprot:ORX65369.1 hypothetical protein BCR32DRAFT_297749 [Anaeromyces robustus]